MTHFGDFSVKELQGRLERTESEMNQSGSDLARVLESIGTLKKDLQAEIERDQAEADKNRQVYKKKFGVLDRLNFLDPAPAEFMSSQIEAPEKEAKGDRNILKAARELEVLTWRKRNARAVERLNTVYNAAKASRSASAVFALASELSRSAEKGKFWLSDFQADYDSARGDGFTSSVLALLATMGKESMTAINVMYDEASDSSPFLTMAGVLYGEKISGFWDDRMHRLEGDFRASSGGKLDSALMTLMTTMTDTPISDLNLTYKAAKGQGSVLLVAAALFSEEGLKKDPLGAIAKINAMYEEAGGKGENSAFMVLAKVLIDKPLSIAKLKEDYQRAKAQKHSSAVIAVISQLSGRSVEELGEVYKQLHGDDWGSAVMMASLFLGDHLRDPKNPKHMMLLAALLYL